MATNNHNALLKGTCIFLIIIIWINAYQKSFGQAPGIEWQKALGGTADDMVLTIKQTSDEGFIIGGVTASKDGDVTNSKGKGDLWVVKMDKTGKILWKKTLGGSNEEQGCNVIETSDGGYLIAGNTSSNSGDVKGFHGGSSDIWIIKLSGTGGIQWQRALGGSNTDEVVNIKEVANGYLVAGNTNSRDGDVLNQHGDFDIWLVRLTITGSIGWQQTLGGPGTEKIRDLQIQNGQYLFAGYTTANGGNVSGHHGNSDIWIGRLSETSELWQKCLGGSKWESEFSNSIKPTADGGFLVAGFTLSKDGDVDGTYNEQAGWVVKFNDNNNIIWQTIIPEGDGASAFLKTIDDGCIFSSTITVVNGEQRSGQPQIIRLANDGSLLWSKNIHTSPSIIDTAANGGFIASGYTTNVSVDGYHKGLDAWLLQLNSAGNTVWEKAYGGSNNDFLQGRTAVYTGTTFPINTSSNAPWNTYIPSISSKDGGYYFAVSTGSNDFDVTGFHYNSRIGYRFDIWAVKIMPEAKPVVINTKTLLQQPDLLKHKLYPNPAKDIVTVQFKALETAESIIQIFKADGVMVKQIKSGKTLKGTFYRYEVNLSGLAAGNYSYKLLNGKTVATGSLIKTN